MRKSRNSGFGLGWGFGGTEGVSGKGVEGFKLRMCEVLEAGR